jgi:spore germination cell wall hydrolase CwlJ-like protein
MLLVAVLLCTPTAQLGGDVLRFATLKLQPAHAAAPVMALDPQAARPFVLRASTMAERKRAVNCLADAVYYEAGTEPLEDQRAVAQVVLNRVRDHKFPPSVCGVVYQRGHHARHHMRSRIAARGVCQFSFACDGSSHRRPPGERQLARARAVAEQALNGRVAPEVGTATYYHASYVHPAWRHELVRVNRLGAHIFYREPGGPDAELRVAGLERAVARS